MNTLAKIGKVLTCSSVLWGAFNCHANAEWVAGIGGGVNRLGYSAGQTISIAPNPVGGNFVNTYTVNEKYHTSGSINLHGGYLFSKPNSKFKFLLQLQAFHNFPTTIKGQVLEGGVAGFNNFDNSFKISTTGLIFSGRLIADKPNWSVQPYVSGGMGAVMHYAYNYNEVPNTAGGVSLRGSFASKIVSNFAYEYGLGLMTRKNDFIFSIELKRQELGDSQLGLYPVQTINDPLKVNMQLMHLQFNVTKVLA